MDDKRLEELAKAIDAEEITREEFLQAFKNIMEQILKLKDEILKNVDYKQNEERLKLDRLQQDFRQNAEGIIKDFFDRSQSKTKIDATLKKVDGKLVEMNKKMTAVKDGAPGLAGQNADEGRIVGQVLKRIIIPKLDYTELEKLRQEWEVFRTSRVMLGGGGFSKIHMEQKFIDDETPSGTVNGSNATFTLANVPNPPASVKVFVNGARMRVTDDYTLSSKTITFGTAPPSSSIILVDYRT